MLQEQGAKQDGTAWLYGIRLWYRYLFVVVLLCCCLLLVLLDLDVGEFLFIEGKLPPLISEMRRLSIRVEGRDHSCLGETAVAMSFGGLLMNFTTILRALSCKMLDQ